MPSVGPGTGTQLWTPLDGGVNGRLLAWWDARDSSCMTVTAGALNQWRDKTGRYVLTNASAVRGLPRYGNRWLGNGLVVDYQGASNSDALRTTALTSSLPGTVFILVDVDAAANGYFFDSANLANRWALGYNLLGTSKYDMFAGGSGIASADGSSTGPRVYSAVFNGASSDFRKDGASAATGNPGTNTLDGFTIGASASNNFGLDGGISQIVVYAGALPVQDRVKVELALAYIGGYGAMGSSPPLVFT